MMVEMGDTAAEGITDKVSVREVDGAGMEGEVGMGEAESYGAAAAVVDGTIAGTRGTDAEGA